MKIKIGSWADYDFDKEDAKIAVPLILLLLGLALTSLRKEWLLAGVDRLLRPVLLSASVLRSDQDTVCSDTPLADLQVPVLQKP
jgi:hypothetical protein